MVNDHSYNTKLVSECLIKPKHNVEKPSQPHHYMAPFGLKLLLKSYMQKGLLFNKPPTFDATQFTKKLKIALSLALVHFYPLAGRLATDKYEEEHKCCIFVDCNKGPGARFIHAELDMSVSDIVKSSADNDALPVIWSLFDHGDRGVVNHDGHSRALVSVQVTELVDGVFIGFTMNHSVADATTMWQFVSTLSDVYLSNADIGENIIHTISCVPIYWSQEGVDPVIKLPFLNSDEFITRISEDDEHLNLRRKRFHFSAAAVALLKSIANAECKTDENCITISSFQSLCGMVWRCVTKARRLPADAETSCSLAVNSRPRFNPPLSQDTFGNFVTLAIGTSKAGELLASGLGSAAFLLHQAVAGQDDKAARSALDAYVKAPFIVHQPGWSPSIPYRIVVGGSPRFEMYGPEFGLGRAVEVLPGYTNKPDGKVTANPGRGSAGSVELEISLTAEAMANLESDKEFLKYVS